MMLQSSIIPSVNAFIGKENEMLQLITIEIQDASQFESILRGALDREVHLVSMPSCGHGIACVSLKRNSV
jgi:hypothetical protein